MTRFENKAVLITGGALGIGLATARRIASEGGRVALLDHAEDDLKAALTQLESEGAACIGTRGDVASPADCDRAVQQTLHAFGRLDVLVANAGARAFGSLLEATDEDWERILGVNLRGVANACVSAARAMKAGGQGGAMVLVSSLHALIGRRDMPLYDATKAAVLSLARSLAVDLAGDNIRVNTVCPGFTVTDYHIRRAEAQGRTADDCARPGPACSSAPPSRANWPLPSPFSPPTTPVTSPPRT
jgi:NAD(P)-dependent dehydrogenase (short-subunit alcohol dehydrogenase family)